MAMITSSVNYLSHLEKHFHLNMCSTKGILLRPKEVFFYFLFLYLFPQQVFILIIPTLSSFAPPTQHKICMKNTFFEEKNIKKKNPYLPTIFFSYYNRKETFF